MKKFMTALLALAITAAAPFLVFSGWQQEGSGYVYYEADGSKATNIFRKRGMDWYYLDENGNVVKNCEREINGKVYSFDANGVCDTANARSVGTAKKNLEQEKLDESILNERQQYINQAANPYIDNETVQWMNATYAILTAANGQNIKAFGGTVLQTGKMSNGELADQVTVENTRKLLSDSWNISDRAGADLILEQLLTSARAGGSAWDYSRAMSNLGYYYLAGYYVETEALDRGLEIAKEIQALYGSWDVFAESYLAGYASWSGDSSESRRQIYESLKQSSWNPYALDWNLPLEKNW